MTIGGLGKLYADGEVVVRQGEIGNCMFVIQSGSAEVVRESDGSEVSVATLRKGDTFGEMAIFEHEVRSASVRALGEARILTIDKRTFLRRVQEDPTLAFNILKTLCGRIRHLNSEIVDLSHRLGALHPGAGGSPPTDPSRGPSPHGAGRGE